MSSDPFTFDPHANMPDPGTAPSTPSSADSNFRDDLLEGEPSPTVERGEMFDSPVLQEDAASAREELTGGEEVDAMDTQNTGDAIVSSHIEADQTTSSKQKGKEKAQPEGIDVGGWIADSSAAGGVGGGGGGKKEPLLDEALVKAWNKNYAGIVDRMAYPSEPAVEQSQQIKTSS